MPPDIDNGTPGRSVGNAPSSNMHTPHTTTSSTVRRSMPALAITAPISAAPVASKVSEVGNSQPTGTNAYSLMSVCTGSASAATWRRNIVPVPAPMVASPLMSNPFTPLTSRNTRFGNIGNQPQGALNEPL